MAQFAIETRRWLESAIKQRRFLLKNNKSQKPQHEIEAAIDILKRQLECYTFENDLYMARFIRNNWRSIETILPGAGASCHDRRVDEFTEIYRKAVQIIGFAQEKAHTHVNTSSI